MVAILQQADINNKIAAKKKAQDARPVAVHRLFQIIRPDPKTADILERVAVISVLNWEARAEISC
jgi:hypothetical protein